MDVQQEVESLLKTHGSRVSSETWHVNGYSISTPQGNAGWRSTLGAIRRALAMSGDRFYRRARCNGDTQ